MSDVDSVSRECRPEPRPWQTYLVVGVATVSILSGAAVLRYAASGGDLWLDEIWSLTLAEKAERPLDVLTRIHHDNNHPLNTLWLYCVGDRQTWIVYRVPALVAGVATVLVAGLIARRRGTAEYLTALLLFGSSYLMIHYSSEARGYGLMILFALLALYLMQRYLDGRRWMAWVFCPVAIAGFLSHLTFIHAYLAVLVWSVARFVRDRRGWRSVFFDVARCHLAPLVFLIVFYFIQIRHLAIGGGPEWELLDVLLTAAALTLGAPEASWCALAAGLIALPVFCSGLVLLWRERSGLWLFGAIAIVVSPALLLVARPPEFLAVRYFLVSIAVFLLLLSRLLAAISRWGRWGLATYVLLVALFVFGNSLYTLDLVREGRGDYTGALQYMVEHTPGEVITVGSDHDFRNVLVLSFYTRRLGGSKRLEYVVNAAGRRPSPLWFIAHSFDRSYRPPEALRARSGTTYVLVKTFGYARLSGCRWFVYRRSGDQAAGELPPVRPRAALPPIVHNPPHDLRG